jgi:Amt family ammonium transporter
MLAKRTCVAGPRQVWFGVGTMFVWFGWFGLVAAAPRFVTGLPAAAAGARAAANVALGGGVGGLIAALLNRVNRSTRDWDLGATCNGIMAGLVSVSAAAHVLQPWAAFVVAFLGGALYFGAAKIVAALKIDDATEAIAVHLVCGFWSMLAAAFFADAKLLAAATLPEAAAPADGKPMSLCCV